MALPMGCVPYIIASAKASLDDQGQLADVWLGGLQLAAC